MNIQRLSRLPKRLWQDLKIIRLAENWRELLSAKAANREYSTVRLRNGVVLNSPREVDLNFLFHEIWVDEFYSPKGYEIRPGQTIIDIGANIGVFAFWAATRASDVRVRSYEPFPANADFFRANLDASMLRNVEFYPSAVADSEGRRTLRIENAWILHSLAEKGSNENGLEVDCVSLDMVLADIARCHLLKLDCEGGEYEIFYHASDESLKKIDRIVCEFNELDDDQRNARALRDFLIAKGFSVDRIDMLGGGSGMMCAKRANV